MIQSVTSTIEKADIARAFLVKEYFLFFEYLTSSNSIYVLIE